MQPIYIFLIFILCIIVSIFLITFGMFAYILNKKYKYLFKVVKKMENDKYLWPLNKKISNGIVKNIDLNGDTLLIGVGSCSILDYLVKNLNSDVKIDVIDSNQYLLDLAREKYGDRCNYIQGEFIFQKLEKLYKNVISSLPHKEFTLEDIERIFNKYYALSFGKIIYFESKLPHVKNSYVKMLVKQHENWLLDTKKNYRNIPPVNLCILTKN